MLGVVPRTASLWGGDGSVMNSSLGAPGNTPLLCMPSTLRGSAGGDLFPHSVYVRMEISNKNKSLGTLTPL